MVGLRSLAPDSMCFVRGQMLRGVELSPLLTPLTRQPRQSQPCVGFVTQPILHHVVRYGLCNHQAAGFKTKLRNHYQQEYMHSVDIFPHLQLYFENSQQCERSPSSYVIYKIARGSTEAGHLHAFMTKIFCERGKFQKRFTWAKENDWIVDQCSNVLFSVKSIFAFPLLIS
ncbi:hypothetical protein CRENBAI_012883 [Crenichthys baileyi]|uniref:Uncharacterized protein n=1 Tax=Crenichthys baileyi TaxID=28760 RepID=A0AAV9R2Q0_9TELE